MNKRNHLFFALLMTISFTSAQNTNLSTPNTTSLCVDTATALKFELDGKENVLSVIVLSKDEAGVSIPEGKYLFKVKVMNTDGKWSNDFNYTFSAPSPWWKSWWANLLYILVFASSLIWFYSYRASLLKKENRLLQGKLNSTNNSEEIIFLKEELAKALKIQKDLQSDLIQSEKMASLGELTAGIAHEIQNPLNFVNNFSDINSELIDEMKEEIDKGNMEDVIAIANDISENEKKINLHGKRAEAIVKGMLQHSRTNNGEKEPTNINKLADEFLRLAYHGLRAKDKSFNAIMKTDFDETIGNINIIPQDIGRVILNLITNAFYAVADKKKLQPKDYEPTVYVSTKKSEGKILITIRDNGNGISKETLDKIFQPFFTTKPTGKGTGLGLSLSFDIVNAHGGEIKVHTEEGKFAEFIIILPL